MYMNVHSIKKETGLFFALIVVALGVGFPTVSHAAACPFTRDLQMGVTGEDVKCLQQYLNGAGFTIASTGAGAPGKETGEFKTLTQAALIKWQTANGITPASGVFGPKSRAKYIVLYANSTVTPSTPSTPASTPTNTSGSQTTAQLVAQVTSLKAEITKLKANQGSGADSQDESEVKDRGSNGCA